MYDAMGVRRETGIQAQVLNEMLKVFEDMGRSEISAHDKLKEFVGHTPAGVDGCAVRHFMRRGHLQLLTLITNRGVIICVNINFDGSFCRLRYLFC